MSYVDEANLSAAQPAPGPAARVPAPHADPRGPRSAEDAPASGPEASDDGVSRLGRARRLRKGPEFERVFKEGVAIGGPFLLVRTIANDVGHVRWGFAAGKKVFPGSPARNRMRRRMKAAAVELDVEGGVDVVVVARSAAAGMEFERLVDELQRQLRRVGYVVARREL